MYWECETGFYSEAGDWAVGNVGLHDLLDSMMDDFDESDDEPASYFGWYYMLEIYSQRNITFGKDRLPALSGLASWMATRFEDQYCAGLWWKDIRVGLLWRAKTFLERLKEWRAP